MNEEFLPYVEYKVKSRSIDKALIFCSFVLRFHIQVRIHRSALETCLVSHSHTLLAVCHAFSESEKGDKKVEVQKNDLRSSFRKSRERNVFCPRRAFKASFLFFPRAKAKKLLLSITFVSRNERSLTVSTFTFLLPKQGKKKGDSEKKVFVEGRDAHAFHLLHL